MRHPTVTGLEWCPPRIPTGGTSTCTATVHDTVTVPALATSPSGTVTFGVTSLQLGRAHVCTPVSLHTPTPTSAWSNCAVTYSPATVGAHTITATYGGDATHSGSSDTFVLPPTFFFNDTAPTEIYTLSLHDALPICTATVHDTVTVPALATSPSGTVTFGVTSL